MFLVTWRQGPRWDVAAVPTQRPRWEGARVPSPTQWDARGSRRSRVLRSTGPERPPEPGLVSYTHGRGVGPVPGCASVFKFSNKFNDLNFN